MRSHSPRTPTPPMILKQLRETPPPSPHEVPTQLSDLSALDILIRFQSCVLSGSLPRLSGEAVVFPDGVGISRSSSTGVQLGSEVVDAGGLWLVAAALNTYESDIAAAARSRRGLMYIPEAQRRGIKEFLFGRVGVDVFGLQGSVESQSSSVIKEDPETLLIAKKVALDEVANRKEALEERVKELSAKIEKYERQEKKKAVSGTVADLIKRGKQVAQTTQLAQQASVLQPTQPIQPQQLDIPESPEAMDVSEEPNVVDPEMRAELALILAEELEVSVEYLRIGQCIRELNERKFVIERKIKRFNLENTENQKRLKSALVKLYS